MLISHLQHTNHKIPLPETTIVMVMAPILAPHLLLKKFRRLRDNSKNIVTVAIIFIASLVTLTGHLPLQSGLLRVRLIYDIRA